MAKQLTRRTEQVRAAQDTATATLLRHPLFRPMIRHVSIIRGDNSQADGNSWARFTHHGDIHLSDKTTSPDEWTWVIAHCLLQLGFGHAETRRYDEAWGTAADVACSRFLDNLKIGQAPTGLPTVLPATEMRRLAAQYATTGIPDEIKGLGTGPHGTYGYLPSKERRWGQRDWDTLFAQGLRDAVTNAVAGDNSTKTEWHKAIEWVVGHYPLLAGLAVGFDIITDDSVLAREDVAVAAVNVTARELLFNTHVGYSTEEYRFVAAHELLHVGLGHDQRCGTRDPYLWNISCFPAGTLLPGNVPIEEVATMQRHYKGDLIGLRTAGGEVEATPEHPFWTRRHQPQSHPATLGDAEWVVAEELTTSAHLCMPTIVDKCFDTSIDLRPDMEQDRDHHSRHTVNNRDVSHRAGTSFPLTPDTAWLIGLWVANGTAHPNVRFSLGTHQQDIIERIQTASGSIGMRCSTYGNARRPTTTTVALDSTTTTVALDSVAFGRWLTENCGAGATNKHVPKIIVEHGDREIRAAFIHGLVDGNSYRSQTCGSSQHTRIVATSSKALMHDLALLLAQDGIGGHASSRTQKDGRVYRFAWNPAGCATTEHTIDDPTLAPREPQWKSESDGVWYPITAVTRRPFDGPVYNQSTESHTYITHSFLVHNCDLAVNDWLHEAQIGSMPAGCLYDKKFAGWSTEEIYDEVEANARKWRKAATFSGRGKGDIRAPEGSWWSSAAGVALDAYLRRALAAGWEEHQRTNRGTLPAGMVEEIKARITKPIPWDVKLAEWFDHRFAPREPTRTWSRASRRQASTPDIARPGRHVPEEPITNRTFAVLLDTSGSMDRTLLSHALGAIGAYAQERDVQAVRLICADAQPYDHGYVDPEDIMDRYKIRGRGGTVLQPAVELLNADTTFPKTGPLLVITDGAIDRLTIARDHAYLMPPGARLPYPPKGPVFSFD